LTLLTFTIYNLIQIINYTMNSKVAKYSAAGCVIAFFWEHVARLNNIDYKPSWVFNHIAIFCNNLFERLGKVLGMTSSYFWFLKLGELKKTICDLFSPLWSTLTSPFSIGIGWINYVQTFLGENFATDSWQFYLRLVGIFVIVAGLGWRYFRNQKKND